MNLDNLMSKHLTRYFDSSKTIPAESLQQLLRFLRTVPSSVNVQASRYYVLGTPEGKERLAGNLGERFLDNGGKIRDASHVLVFTTRADVPDSHLEEVFGKEKADGRFPDPAKQSRWESMTRDFLNLRTYGYKDLTHWMEKQTYLALGMTMKLPPSWVSMPRRWKVSTRPLSMRHSKSEKPDTPQRYCWHSDTRTPRTHTTTRFHGWTTTGSSPSPEPHHATQFI
ncbi:Oxygen-insensitive NAD(P)H nitroreductase [Mycobacteroides abscessus]|nr:Oxygen-insensitive NAD(P)H nitroreductase [Mycobacteroides abscessus]CPR59098.1 Oxygen-insensitive NAD(P)H nitroreductase [Mycobacteroides abscessus]CPS19122.1 Oxygen-insensitive NAD(P)H nitroreductase [Mycobacteroides abscessus]CPV11826.1 Oxygen-insensitive NAD(P)H nitroreductase [Mycobacteroides abscessus]